MEKVIIIQEAGLGIIGWVIVFGAIFFITQAFKKKKNDDKNDDNVNK